MPDDESYKNALTEWQEARATISKCEECLDGLRRYGFTVIAGLLAVDAIQSYINLGNPAKIGLIVITIAFIIGLYLLDVYYQRIIEAATIRARILETTVLNFELNETLSERFEHEGLKTYIKWIYIGFILIAVLIGIMVVISAVPSPLTTSINSSINTTSSNSGIPSNISVNSSSQSITLVNSTSTNIVDSGTLSTKVTNSSTLSTKVTNSSTLSTNITNTNTSSTIIVNSSTLSTTEVIHKDRSFSQKYAPGIILLILLGFLYNFMSKFFKGIKEIIKESPTITFMFLVTSVFVIIGYYLIPNLNFEFSIVIPILMLSFIGVIGAFFIELFTNMRLNTLKSGRLQPGMPQESSNNSGDWIIDKNSCILNEKIKITITNLNEEEIKFKPNETFCEIKSHDGKYNRTIKIDKEAGEITIPKYGTYSCFWDTREPDDNGNKTVEGIYRIKPRRFLSPLRRAIVVSKGAKQGEPTVT